MGTIEGGGVGMPILWTLLKITDWLDWKIHGLEPNATDRLLRLSRQINAD